MEAAGELDQLGAHLIDRQREIHEPVEMALSGMSAWLGSVAVAHLGQRSPPRSLMALMPSVPSPSAAGEHHADRELALLGGERAEEDVDGLAFAPTRIRPSDQ